MKKASVVLGVVLAGLVSAVVVKAGQAGTATKAPAAPATAPKAAAPKAPAPKAAAKAAPAQPAAPADPNSVAGTAKTPGNLYPPARKATPTSPALTPEEEMKTFSLPPGYHAQLVASDPMIVSPIMLDFDLEGRMWVLEMQGFLPDMTGRDSHDPLCDVAVLEDTNHDGVMDKKTIFASGLDLPRAMKVTDHGVLIGEPPHLWLMKDTNGDLKADTKDEVFNAYGRGGIGIEHNANNLLWAMDNTIYTSEAAFSLRMNNGKIESQPSISVGQWQGSQDDAGRVWRNVNDSPLFVDYTQAKYFLRNPNGARTRGLYDSVVDQIDATLYPVRPNRGVNRGYRDPFFRTDGSSIVIQGAGSPTVYRGDKYPKDVQGNVFITDSPTNLVHEFKIVDVGGGKLKAQNAIVRGEFIASSDERFRPVNLFSGPDGVMYVVDMYRGVVQDGGIWSDYLRDYIGAHDLQLPVERGRIWRIVYGTGPATVGPMPSLTNATPAQLVPHLSDANGWWRDTAQRLIVERGDKSVVPALTQLATSAPDWRTKLHALWTLDGLDASDPATVQKALVDLNPDVRAAGVRISERWLGQGDQTMVAAVLKLVDDKNWNVRRQLAASIGEMPMAARVDPAVKILARDGKDPIIVDAMVSSLSGMEADVLDRVLKTQAPAPAAGVAAVQPTEAVTALAAAITRGANVAAVQHLIDESTEATRPSWQRLGLLKGMDAVLVAGGSGGAGGAGGGRGGGRGGGGGVSLAGLSTPGAGSNFSSGRGITLPAEPVKLATLGKGTDAMALPAKSLWNKFDWPGRPAPQVIVIPLTAEQQKLYAEGEQIYKTVCGTCHQEDGKGKEKVAANLVDSQYVNANDPTNTIRILLGGKEGSVGAMPGLAGTYNDEQVAAALTYIRRTWGHTAPAVDPLSVMEIRGTTKGRKLPWTDAELAAGAGGRGGGGGGGGARGGGGGGRNGGGAPGGGAAPGAPAPGGN